MATGIYAITVLVFALVAGRARLTEHTAFNHYAHLADAWLHGRQDLRNGAPSYAMGNDFAEYGGKTYISFPPFPALLMLPFVALAGSPEAFCDGQFMVWLAGFAPAFLFLVLEKLRRPDLRGLTRSVRTEGENVVFALLYAFATPFFFTAVEGTVWFAAHVVGAGVLALYVLFALDAERPFLAGLALGCAWMTRPTILLAAPLFALEALRASAPATEEETDGDETPFKRRVLALLRRVDRPALLRRYALFALPILMALALGALSNHARFQTWNPSAGHEFLTVFWKARIQKWGLFGSHYLAKNLGCFLTMLPWLPPHGSSSLGGAPFKINEHGLALWFTSPIYFWLFRSHAHEKAGARWVRGVAWLAALGPAAMLLFYQNSGWRQFAYRFSNDYSVLLFIVLAVSTGPRKVSPAPALRALWRSPSAWLFGIAALWSVGWNLFGAVTFDHPELDRFYYREGTQTVLYQPD